MYRKWISALVVCRLSSIYRMQILCLPFFAIKYIPFSQSFASQPCDEIVSRPQVSAAPNPKSLSLFIDDAKLVEFAIVSGETSVNHYITTAIKLNLRDKSFELLIPPQDSMRNPINSGFLALAFAALQERLIAKEFFPSAPSPHDSFGKKYSFLATPKFLPEPMNAGISYTPSSYVRITGLQYMGNANVRDRDTPSVQMSLEANPYKFDIHTLGAQMGVAALATRFNLKVSLRSVNSWPINYFEIDGVKNDHDELSKTVPSYYSLNVKKSRILEVKRDIDKVILTVEELDSGTMNKISFSNYSFSRNWHVFVVAMVLNIPISVQCELILNRDTGDTQIDLKDLTFGEPTPQREANEKSQTNLSLSNLTGMKFIGATTNEFYMSSATTGEIFQVYYDNPGELAKIMLLLGLDSLSSQKSQP